MAKLDREVLKELAKILESKERYIWVIGILALFLLLYTREINIGRNIFWGRYKDEV